MTYILKQDYVLRGWEKKPWVLVQRPRNISRDLSREEFQVLLLCDGRVEFDSDYITDEMRETLKRLENDAVIDAAESGMTMDEDQYYRYYNNRFVESVFWSVTGRCNFRCRHCYMDAPKGTLGELSHEEAIDLVDQMAECGVLCVDITGGEPFVRPDFWSLVERIQYHKMTIKQIYTNGWLLTHSILDEFRKRGLRPEFSISFDGVGWHDWMRGIPGAEDASLRALRLCIKEKFPTSVEMCIHKGNRNVLRDTVLILSDIGVSRLKVSEVMNTELWRRNSEKNVMDIRECINSMIEYIPYFFRDGMPMQVMLSRAVTLFKGSKRYKIVLTKFNGTDQCRGSHLCGAARSTCYITPEGRLLPCMPMTACKEQEKFPLVQEIGLKKGLSDSFYMDIVDSRVSDLLKVNAECNACAHKYQCGGGCRAAALEQTGDLMGCDENQCILWKEGYVDRIRETVEAAIAKYCPDSESRS